MSERVSVRYEVRDNGDYTIIIETDPYEQREASAIYLDPEQSRIVQRKLDVIVPKLDEVIKLLREEK